MKKEKGFTLIELLATLLIASLIFGITIYYITNTINNSKNKANQISMNNIKKSSNLYIQEYRDTIIWQNNKTCIPIEELLNKGYIKEKQIKDIEEINSIIIIKNNNNKITKHELKTQTCDSKTKLPLPTSKEYCNNLTYNKNNQTLTKSKSNVTYQNNIGKNAGEYIVTVQLKNTTGYIWKDNSITNKTITCTIKKAIPYLYINPTGNIQTVGITQTATLTTNTSGTLQVKSTNKNHVIGTFDNKNITANENKLLKIETLSSRSTTTYLNITLSPTDTTNYYTQTVVYTIGNINRTNVPIPLESIYCENPTYNGSEQSLINNTEHQGYNFINYKAKEVGEYLVTAQLKYGYTWQDNTTQDKTIKCEIKKPTVTILYNANGAKIAPGHEIYTIDSSGYILKNNKKEFHIVDAESKDVNLYNYNSSSASYLKILKEGYLIEKTIEWNTKKDGTGKKFNQNAAINAKDLCNATNGNCKVTLYANWRPTIITLQININGGTFTSANSSWTKDSSGYVLKNKSRTINTYQSTQTNVDIVNYNYSKRFVVSKAGYSVPSTQEYKATVNNEVRTFNQNSLNPKDTCDATSKDCTAVLYVNFQPNKYKVTLNNQSADTAGTTNIWYKFNTSFTYNNMKHYYYTNSNLTTVLENNTITIPTKTGYLFKGYYTKKNGGGTQYVNENGVLINNLFKTEVKNITLYANWQAKTTKFILHRNLTATDTYTKTYSYTYDNTSQKFPGTLYTKTGYSLKGWSLTQNGEIKWNPSNTVTNGMINGRYPSVHIYAVWEINVCTITYDPNGGKFTSHATNTVQKLNYGQETGNMRNAAGDNSYYGGTYTGYSITTSNAWITSNKKTLDQSKSYNAETICPNLTKKSESVTLYANWWKYVYQTRYWSSCITGKNTCQAGYICKAGYTCPTGTTYMGNGLCKLCINDKCSSFERKKATYNSCASSTWSNCKTGSNTCKAGYSNWTTITGTCDTSKQQTCQRIKDFIKPQK